MRILAILFLILPISMLKADEIYNLIKIPNLEVYEITTQNGIRYLNSKNLFIYLIELFRFHRMKFYLVGIPHI